MMKDIQWKKWLGYVGVILFTIHCSLITVSCSEDDSSEDEFANWEERNSAMTDQWAANSMCRCWRLVKGIAVLYTLIRLVWPIAEE